MTTPTRAWAGDEPLLGELSADLASSPLGSSAPPAPLPDTLQRATPAPIPRVPESVLARHFGRLARRNHHLHHGIYPLGSCTMKHNPAIHEAMAGDPAFALLHPFQGTEDAQGTLGLLHEFEQWLVELTGMARFSLQPAAGAHGEWTGLRMIQAFHASRGEGARNLVLVPDSAHGTNPASAHLCGYEVVSIPSTKAGTVDLEAFSELLTPQVAAVMLTNPNTLGVFEKDILTIAQQAHAVGAQLYYDGANLNALVGLVRPGDMGFDVVHINTHKTFSTPHGGGGPGAGPVGVGEHLLPFLPSPTIEKLGGDFVLDYDRPNSIGKVRSYIGNVGVLLRAWAYIRTHGSSIPEVAGIAVLNARYLRQEIEKLFAEAVPGDTLHEFVVSTRSSRAHHLRAGEVAKAMLDYGVYAPTVYFPTTVPEALMFEPTETESKAELDQLAAILTDIVERSEAGEIDDDPPSTPVAHVDEVAAARRPCLTWQAAGRAGLLRGPHAPGQ